MQMRLNVMWTSKMSQNSQIPILRYNQSKGKHSFVCNCFAKSSSAGISGTDKSIFMGFSAKCGIRNGLYNYIEN